MEVLALKNVAKAYEKNQYVIKNLNISIEEKEFVVLLGPSGCGKSTTLRMIAGLEDITEGDLLLNGQRMNDTPAKDRNISMVFQNYALFPHLSVRDNIAFTLNIQHKNKKEVEERVERAAEILDLTNLLDRKPRDLSGGQQQRVALGRAMVNETDFFLMDEPLSNLDANLRTTMREELTQLHKRMGTTTIYVTHDQIEAMTMADKIVVMNKGDIQQIASPEELYDHPANLFVADFIGSPKMNFAPGRIEDGVLLLLGKYPIARVNQAELNQRDFIIGIRPHFFTEAEDGIPFNIVHSEMLGSEIHYSAKLDGHRFKIKIDRLGMESPEGQLRLKTIPHRISLFDPETEQAVYLKKGDLNEV